MIWISVIAAFAVFILLFMFAKTGDRFYAFMMFIAMAFGLVMGTAASIAIVPPGHVGVQVLFGSVKEASLPEGLSAVNPFVTVSHMSGRTHIYTMSGSGRDGEDSSSITALSGDWMTIPMDVSVVYRLDKTHAPWVLQNIGYEYANTLLKPAARTAVRQAAALFTAQEACSTKRADLANEMTKALNRSIVKILKQRGFEYPAIHIEQVLLRNISLPKRVEEAIEEKLEAEQAAQKMDFVLDKERKEAERKEIEARGIQEFQNTVKKGITQDLLRWKGIEATEALARSPNAKIVIIGGGDNGLPVILNTDGSK